MNSPEAEQFEQLYRRLWSALHSPDAADLSTHEMELLHHVPRPGAGAVPLNHLAQHLALPKSTASALVKELERRGFLQRSRDPTNERQLAIVLTPVGADRVAVDTVLDSERLAQALRTLPTADRRTLLTLLDRLATAAAQIADQS